MLGTVTNDEIWDVAVVGAGPAGASAALGALHADPHARVLLLDREDFPRDKSCGDGVAPHVLDVLAGVGAGDLLDDWPGVGALDLGFPGGDRVVGRMERPAFVVPREVLDARLVAAAVARGAVLRRHRVRSVTVGSGGPGSAVQVDGIRARVVVGADGAHSLVRRELTGPQPPRTTAIALRGYAPVSAGRADAQIIAFPTTGAWPAYAWSFPIGDGRANVGYGELLPDDGPGPSKSDMLAGLEALLPGAGRDGQAWRGHHLPLATGRARQPDGPVLLVGDALGVINPLTGEGIYPAVLTGVLAGQAAVGAVRSGRPAAAGRAHRKAMAGQLGRHWRHLGLAARLAQQPRVVAGGVRVAKTDPRIFADLVEMGLGRGAITPRLGRALLPGATRLVLHRLAPGRVLTAGR